MHHPPPSPPPQLFVRVFVHELVFKLNIFDASMWEKICTGTYIVVVFHLSHVKFIMKFYRR